MEFCWMNASDFVCGEDYIEINAPEKSDFFCPLGQAPVGNAPFYYTELEGDFVLRAKVSLEFKDTYDSACLMIMQDMTHWAKACFELTDFGTRAAVSVVTKGSSDDANGCNVEADAIWLQICRAGDAFAFHYSLDGEKFDMMRFFYFPTDAPLKVGLAAQAPSGCGGMRRFEQVTIEARTVENVRAGK
jgi:regulation of enolase protein 1 (concanavalin A-like superfamily)